MNWQDLKRTFFYFEIPHLECPYCGERENAEYSDVCWRCGYPLNTPYKWVSYEEFNLE